MTEFFTMWFSLMAIGFLIYGLTKPKPRKGKAVQINTQDVERIVKKVNEVLK